MGAGRDNAVAQSEDLNSSFGPALFANDRPLRACDVPVCIIADEDNVRLNILV